MRSRLFPLVALACLIVLPSVARPDDVRTKKAAPAIVVRLRSLDGIMADVKYLAEQVGKEEEAKQGEALLKDRIGDKGLEGIDAKKPMGLYLFAGPNGADSYGAIMIPVKDEKAVLGLLDNFNIKVEKSKNGLYTVKDERIKAPVFFRFANGYAYITALNDAGIAKDKLLAPAEVLPESETSLISASIRIDQVPDQLKEIGLGYLSLVAAQAREDKLEGQTKAQKDFAEQMSKESMNHIKSLVNDGREVSLRVDVDRTKKELAISFGLEGKPGTKLATEIADLGKKQSLFAGLAGKDSAFSILFTYALSEKVRKALGPVIDEGVKSAVAKAEEGKQKEISEKLVKVLLPSLKGGDIDLALDLRGPNANKIYTLVGGIKLKDGQAVEKAVKEVIEGLPQDKREVIKLDAEKAGDVSIHRVEFDRFMDDKARAIFGKGPIFFAVRPDALVWAGGADGLKALKQALTAPAGTAGLLRFEMALARLAPLMAKDQPEAPKAAQEAFAKAPGQDRIQVNISGGQTLKAELRMKTAVLKFFTLVGEAKKSSAEQ
jgi:hypothetical protein